MQKQVCIHFKMGKCLYGDRCYKQHSDPTKNLQNVELSQTKVPSEPSPSNTESTAKIEQEEAVGRKAKKKKKKGGNNSAKVEPKCQPSLSFKQEAEEVSDCNANLTEVEPVEYVTEVVEEERW